jgi:DNA polymerase-3 subunit beta
VIPKATDHALTINRKALVDALKRSYVVVKSTNERVVLSVNGNEMTVEAQSPDVGTVTDTLELTLNTLGSLKLAYNDRYLLEALEMLDCEEVTLSMDRPSVVRPVGSDDYLYLIVPLDL